MSKRPYTDVAYDQIRQTIDEIDNAQISPVTDFFGDMLSRIAQFLKIYTVDTYQNDMQQWYRKVLDSHNTTMAKVDTLFANVEAVDSRYESLMRGTYDAIVEFQSVINCLRDTISGKCTLAEGQQATQNHLNAGIQALCTSANTVLTYAEQRMCDNTLRSLVKDLLSFGGLFCKLAVERDPIALASTSKKFVDAVLATACDLATLVSIVPVGLFGIEGIQEKMGWSYEKYLDLRFEQLGVAEKYQGKRSISDLLDGLADDMDENLAACPQDSPYYSITKKLNDIAHGASNVSHTIDFVANTYDLYSGITGTMDTIKEIKAGKLLSGADFLKKCEDGKVSKVEVKFVDGEIKYLVPVDGKETILNAISSRTGIPLTGWNNTEKGPGNVFKTAGTVCSYIDALLPNADGTPNTNTPLNVTLGAVKEISTIKDTLGLASDYADLNSEPQTLVKEAVNYAEYLRDGGNKPPLHTTEYSNRNPYTHSWTKVDAKWASPSGGSGSAGSGGSAGGR